jgi:superfamily II DNA or RNA helicase
MLRATMTVSERIRLSRREIGEEVVDELAQACTHHNPARRAMQRMGIPHWGEPAIVRTWRDEPGDVLSLPRGAATRVLDILDGRGIERALVDRRTEGAERDKGRQGEFNRVPWEHQEAAVRACVEREQGVVHASTGSGKTSAGLMLAAHLQVPTLVLVNTRALLDQWMDRIPAELGLTGKDYGCIRGGKRQLKPVTVSILQSLAIAGVDEEVRQSFGAVIGDECQLFSADSFQKVVDALPARYRIGISADHRRKDKKDYLTRDLFGDVIHETTREEVEASGAILDVEVRIVPTEFRADWYGAPMAGRDQELDVHRLHEEMMADADRNALAVACAEEEMRAGSTVLVMCARREHCQRIDQLLNARGWRTGFLIGGEDYRKEFVRTKERLTRGELQAAVGTLQAVGQAIDVPTLGSVVVASPIASNRQQVGQVRGRACRAPAGKKDARMIYLWDRAIYGISHVQNLIRWNRTTIVRQADGSWCEGREWLRRNRTAKAAP